jgi:hypothetical protein
MKKGKAADVFELTVENILYGEDELLYIDTSVICNMQFGTFIFEYRR